jgi:hypothetical protein
LPAGDLLDVSRVDQQARKAILQHRPHRLPIHAGGLHRDLHDLVRLQPIAKRQQTLHGRLKLRHLLSPSPALPRHPHAGHHGRVVDIQRRGALDDHIHPTAPFSSIDTDRPVAGSLDSRSIL